ncbi:hypothetical protein B0H13DRAFT_2299934 [Mycena leptocephala]|nr:hypothetical protein B0H13DRAFT_2299934 [Mycena leptocephala]
MSKQLSSIVSIVGTHLQVGVVWTCGSLQNTVLSAWDNSCLHRAAEMALWDQFSDGECTLLTASVSSLKMLQAQATYFLLVGHVPNLKHDSSLKGSPSIKVTFAQVQTRGHLGRQPLFVNVPLRTRLEGPPFMTISPSIGLAPLLYKLSS